MKVAPVVHAVSPVVSGDPVEFTFTDDPLWRNAITEISNIHSTNNIGSGNVISRFIIASGEIKYISGLYGVPGRYIWKIVATGYQDVFITVDMN